MDSQHPDAEAEAAKLREAGNARYKSGALSEEASDLVPEDPTPLSNLSAAYFEAGQYMKSYQYALEALKYLKQPSEKLSQRLYARIAKCNILMQQWSLARKTLSQSAETDETRELGKIIEHGNCVWKERSDKARSMEELIRDIPGYKAVIQDEPEYFSVGHDVAESQFDESLAASKDELLAFLFAGIGDVRHLYATLTAIGNHEISHPDSKKKYHFTILDLKAAALSRDLIILYLLRDLSEVKADDKMLKTEMLSTIYFLFCSPLLPPYIRDRLQNTIDRIVSAIQSSSPLPAWVRLRESDKGAILSVLRSWKEEVTVRYEVKFIRELAISGNKKTEIQLKQLYGGEMEVPKGCKFERSLFLDTGMLCTPPALVSGKEGKLGDILKNTKSDIRKITDYIDCHWKTNVTMIDEKWEDNRDDPMPVPDMAFNPFEVAEQLSHKEFPKNAGALYDYVFPSFAEVVKALQRLEGRICVEVICGELGQVAEEMKDYVSGHLTTFYSVLPILKKGKQHHVTSNCLRNPDQWKHPGEFNNEYILTDEPDMVPRLAGAQFVHDRPAFRDIDSNQDVYFMTNYIWWQHSLAPRKQMAYSALVPRDDAQRWLYALFFKIALPFPPPMKRMNTLTPMYSIIWAPLNVTIMFRVLIRLYELGYPAHWLSSVIDSIIANKVYSTARAPRSCPLIVEETKTKFPLRKLSTAPFTAEMSTLTTLWLRNLPFGIQCSTLPAIESIHRYSVKLEQVDKLYSAMPVFILVFVNAELHGPPPINLREILLDVELGDQSAKGKKCREQGVVVVSTIKWFRKESKVKFRMREDVVERICTAEKDSWFCALFRTDLWHMQSKILPANEKTVVKVDA